LKIYINLLVSELTYIFYSRKC